MSEEPGCQVIVLIPVCHRNTDKSTDNSNVDSLKVDVIGSLGHPVLAAPAHNNSVSCFISVFTPACTPCLKKVTHFYFYDNFGKS